MLSCCKVELKRHGVPFEEVIYLYSNKIRRRFMATVDVSEDGISQKVLSEYCSVSKKVNSAHIHLTSLCFLPTHLSVPAWCGNHTLALWLCYIKWQLNKLQMVATCSVLLWFAAVWARCELHFVSFKHLRVGAFLITPGLMWYIPFQKATLPPSIIRRQGCSTHSDYSSQAFTLTTGRCNIWLIGQWSSHTFTERLFPVAQ